MLQVRVGDCGQREDECTELSGTVRAVPVVARCRVLAALGTMEVLANLRVFEDGGVASGPLHVKVKVVGPICNRSESRVPLMCESHW